MFLKSSACGTLLILCKLGKETRRERPRFSRFAAHHSPLVCSRDVRSIALKTLGKERDCSQSYFISLPLIFNSQNFKTAGKHNKKASGDLMANARDLRVGVNLIGLTNFISTVVGPNLTSCHLKLILVTPLGSKTRKLGAFGSHIPTNCSKT